MTPRENLLKVLHREGVGEVPLDLVFSPHQYDRLREESGSADMETHFRLPHRRVQVEMRRQAQPELHFANAIIPERTTIDAWGVGHTAGSEAAYHMTRLHHPLKGLSSLRQAQDYPMPRIDTEAEVSRIARQVDRIHRGGFAAVGLMEQTVWETAWAIRSMEDLMVDMMSDDDAAAILLDRVTEVSRVRSRILAEAGCDVVQLGDDIGMQQSTMMSVDLWRRWLKPRLAQVISEARSAKPDIIIFYHSCGYVLPFIDDLIEVGVEVLNPVQPECMSFEEVHRRFGDRLSFWGTIGTQGTMPYGSTVEVRQEVTRNVQLCGESGGLVIAPTHMLEPDVPWRNIVALREACDELSTGSGR